MKNWKTRLGRTGPWPATWAPLAASIVLTRVGGAYADVGAIAGMLRGGLAGFQNLLLIIAMGMLGAGIAIKFLPTGSHRTKDAAGQLIDNALIIGGLTALGLYIVSFAGEVAVTATGMGQKPNISGPWTPPG